MAGAAAATAGSFLGGHLSFQRREVNHITEAASWRLDFSVDGDLPSEDGAVADVRLDDSRLATAAGACCAGCGEAVPRTRAGRGDQTDCISSLKAAAAPVGAVGRRCRARSGLVEGLHEGVSRDDHRSAAVALSPRMGRSRALSREYLVDPVVGVLLGVVVHGGNRASTARASACALSVVTSSGRRGRGVLEEESPGRRGVAADRDQHIDDLAVLVDGPVDVAPVAGHLHVGLVDEPAVADGVAPGRASLINGVNRCTHRYRVTQDRPRCRSANSSSRSGTRVSKRRYQRTASRITSGGCRNPGEGARRWARRNATSHPCRYAAAIRLRSTQQTPAGSPQVDAQPGKDNGLRARLSSTSSHPCRLASAAPPRSTEQTLSCVTAAPLAAFTLGRSRNRVSTWPAEISRRRTTPSPSDVSNTTSHQTPPQREPGPVGARRLNFVSATKHTRSDSEPAVGQGHRGRHLRRRAAADAPRTGKYPGPVQAGAISPRGRRRAARA